MDLNGKLYLTDTLLKKINMPISSQIKVRIGVKEVMSSLVIRNSNEINFVLSPELAKALSFYNRKRLQIRYDKENNLVHIGPTIGILTAFLPNQPEFNPTSIQAELIFLSKLGAKLPAQFYIFTPSSINWESNTVKGFIYRLLDNQQGVWLSSIYPLPDVVYDRISTRKGEAQARIRKTKIE
jgi:hypothetical protein